MTTSVEIVEFDHNIIEHLAVRMAGHHNRPAYAVLLPATAVTAKLPYSGLGVLLGYSIAVPGVTAGSVQLFDGQDASGQLLAVEGIAAGASITKWFGPAGIVISSGLAAAITQPVIGVVWVRTRNHPAIG